jgi:hypothetical protein
MISSQAHLRYTLVLRDLQSNRLTRNLVFSSLLNQNLLHDQKRWKSYERNENKNCLSNLNSCLCQNVCKMSSEPVVPRHWLSRSQSGPITSRSRRSDGLIHTQYTLYVRKNVRTTHMELYPRNKVWRLSCKDPGLAIGLNITFPSTILRLFGCWLRGRLRNNS